MWPIAGPIAMTVALGRKANVAYVKIIRFGRFGVCLHGSLKMYVYYFDALFSEFCLSFFYFGKLTPGAICVPISLFFEWELISRPQSTIPAELPRDSRGPRENGKQKKKKCAFLSFPSCLFWQRPQAGENLAR